MASDTNFDLILRGARIAGREAEPAGIGIAAGRIVAIAPSLPTGGVQEERLDGQLVLPGLVETHIHLDKSRIIDRCTISAGTVKEAIAETARAKAAFTEADIEARGRRTLEQAILAGTQFMRTHVEVDPRIGLKSFHVLQALSSVTCSLATNNVLNPLTPFGDASLMRMANLYANIAQLGRPAELRQCLDMITSEAARLMNLDGYGISVGNAADLIVLPCLSGPSAVAEIARPLWGLKRGRRSFFNASGQLFAPGVS
jgi:cytosine/adenosine deaminase-related metal-dependent hydrolase